MDDLFFELCNIGIINLRSDHGEKPCFHCFCFIHGLYGMKICDISHFRDDLFILGCGNLCAILPVYLVAVVFRRIVACGDHNTCCTAELADSK